MRRILIAVIAPALTASSFLNAQTAGAADVTPKPTPAYSQPMTPPVKPLDCVGTTGRFGCGPGWFWRDGWRGWGCYPC
jgi:hypothetical protein